jgi:hypothetical protein
MVSCSPTPLKIFIFSRFLLSRGNVACGLTRLPPPPASGASRGSRGHTPFNDVGLTPPLWNLLACIIVQYGTDEIENELLWVIDYLTVCAYYVGEICKPQPRSTYSNVILAVTIGPHSDIPVRTESTQLVCTDIYIIAGTCMWLCCCSDVSNNNWYCAPVHAKHAVTGGKM